MLRMIEGFDIWDHKSKAANRFAFPFPYDSTSYLGSAADYDQVDVAAIAADDCFDISLNSGRYSGNALVVSSKVFDLDYDTCNPGPCLNTGNIAAGGVVRIPIPAIFGPGSTNYRGVYGFSFKFDKKYSTYYAPGGTTGNSTGQAIFAIGQGQTATSPPYNFYPFVGIYLDTKNKLQIRGQNSGSASAFNTAITVDKNFPTYSFILSSDSSGSFELQENTWYNIEIRTTLSLSGASNRTQELFVNGNLYATATTTSTHLNAIVPFYAYFMCAIALSGSIQTDLPLATTVGNINHYFDNFYVADDFGPSPNNVLGSWKTSKLEVTGDYLTSGVTFQGAASRYQAISGNDEATSYTSTVSGVRQGYEFSNLSSQDTILGISYKMVTEIPNATGVRLIPLYIDSGGVQYSGLFNHEKIALSGGGWFYHEAVLPSSLVNNSLWTKSQIDDGRFGFVLGS